MLQRPDLLPGSSRIPPRETADDEILPRQDRDANDALDDVFGSAPPSPSDDPRLPAPGNREPSEVPRLREKHETEGYRDGVTKGKAESVQAGFDEGYHLGAVLGLRIGKILGLLEGVVAGVGEGEGEAEERGRLEALWRDARTALGTERVFAREWWGEDGVWTFAVPEEQEGDVVFGHVASAHPLVRQWEAVVRDEVERWRLDLGILHAELEDAEEDDELRGKRKGARATMAGKGEVESEPVAAAMARAMGIEKKHLSW